MLALESLVSGYHGARSVVVGATTLNLAPGSFVCVIGRNGAGKSTLMRTICGLQPALGGTAAIDGRVVSQMSARDRGRAVAVVTTDRVSSPGLIARDVVELGRQPYTDWRGQLAAEDRRAVANALRRAGAEPFAPKSFDSLSDGERQRVMIARALAQSSQIMVLDEITAFLDLPGRVEVMALLRRHAEATGTIVLLSSHDLELSLELALELWIVDDGELVRGAPDELVDQGAVARAFDSADVTFDAERRRFVLREEGCGITSI
ncbi:MAG: ABC transporter ATP-binding protein [Planctomycetota bacterium]